MSIISLWSWQKEKYHTNSDGMLYIQKDVPTESTIRKFYLDDCYEEMMTNIRRVFLKKNWISVDETTDAEGRQIANAIIGTLEDRAEDPSSIKIAKKNVVKKCVKSNLVYIKSNFKLPPDSILKLQKKNMPLAESLDILEKVQV
ncbi:hypothetical protein QTP88_003816 [Uroleucon formosanum]